jgi:hypothetical protein
LTFRLYQANIPKECFPFPRFSHLNRISYDKETKSFNWVDAKFDPERLMSYDEISKNFNLSLNTGLII